MGQFFSNTFYRLYGGGLIEEIREQLTNIVGSISGVISGDGGILQAGFSALAAISIALLILFFFVDLIEQSMRDTFTFEKLIVSFIKLLIAVVIVICAKDIISEIVKLAKPLFNIVAKSTELTKGTDTISGAITQALGASDENDEIVKDFYDNCFPTKILTTLVGRDKFFAQLRLMFSHITITLECIIIVIIDWILRLMAYFLAISAVITLGLRCFFSPIAVVQIYEGQRSTGMRYLKMLMADVCVFAGMLVVLYIAQLLGNSLISQNTDSVQSIINSVSSVTSGIPDDVADAILCNDGEDFENVMKVGVAWRAIVPDIAAVGAMGGVSRIIREAFGA